MSNVIDLQSWRDALAAAEATDTLHDLLGRAAARCAAGEFSAGDRSALFHDLVRALFESGDGKGWSVAHYSRAAAPKPDDVLHDVLSLAADEAGARILSAEGRAILINAVFLALGDGWKIERAT